MSSSRKSGNKTVETRASVKAFIDAVDDERKRRDSRELAAMMSDITGSEPKMWGSSMVGFGHYHYKYASGREGDFFLTGFSPRKTALAVYIMTGFDDCAEQLARLGPYKTGKSCLYLKNLDAIDRDVLEEIVRDSVKVMRSRYACE
jgi:hypothetical protein